MRKINNWFKSTVLCVVTISHVKIESLTRPFKQTQGIKTNAETETHINLMVPCRLPAPGVENIPIILL